MRICLYTGTALPKRDGQEVVVDSLAREFMALKHEVVVLAPSPRSPIRVDDSRFPYPVVRHPRFYSTRRLVSWYRWFLFRIHRTFSFELLHCHGIYPPGYLAALGRTRLGVPIVITNHDGTINDGNVRLAKPLVYRRYLEALAAADALVAVSQRAYDGYKKLCPEAGLIVTIPNGTDVKAMESPESRPPGLQPSIKPGGYLLYIGRLRYRKGVDLLLAAFSQASISKTIRLVIAGDGDEGPALKDQITKLHLEDRVHFVGWVSGSLKTYLLQNAFCTVIPSRWSEAFGLVVLESYAAGRPVVATDIPGLSELIVQDQTGVLVEPESAASIARALNEMVLDPQRTAKRGEQARRFVQDFSWQAIAQRHLQLYEDLLTSKGRKFLGESNMDRIQPKNKAQA